MTPREILLQASLDLQTIAISIPTEYTMEFNLRKIEERTIHAALSSFKTKTAAARALGVTPQSLDMKILRYGIKYGKKNKTQELDK